jgi:MFS family permease
LRAGYLVGTAGAGIALLAAITRSYPLLCLGVLGAGAGNAANLATRYAASDLAQEERRARTISVIVWATVVGSTAGSVVSGAASDVGEAIGLPAKAGSYLLSALMFLLAAAIVEFKLRPDPLVVAGGIGRATSATGQAKPSARESLSLIWANPAARLAVAAMVVSQVTMVGVMSLTPLHMDEGGQSQGVIGLMMAFHIWGMYLFSPVVGSLTDRFGQYPMLYVSGGLCTWGAMWAAVTPPEGALGVFMGNFLIGLGWSFGVVAASSLIVAQFPIEQRLGVQGVGDLAMIGSGAIAGVSSGMLYSLFGYGGVNVGNAVFGALLILGTVWTYVVVRRQPTVVAAGPAVGG